jgi:hypothetical protein
MLARNGAASSFEFYGRQGPKKKVGYDNACSLLNKRKK